MSRCVTHRPPCRRWLFVHHTPSTHLTPPRATHHQDAEDALEFGGAASEGEGEEAGGKVEEEEEGPDLRDELDSESPRKAKSKKRQRPGASKKQGGAKRARKADYESDEEAGISVIKTGSPVRDPSSKYGTLATTQRAQSRW